VLFVFLIFFPTFRFVFTKSTPQVLEDVVPLVNCFVNPVDARCLSLLNVGFPAAFAEAFFGLYLGILLCSTRRKKSPERVLHVSLFLLSSSFPAFSRLSIARFKELYRTKVAEFSSFLVN
tara:strand:- start:1035 stop:1394 length:360 start_codon:yes stop_codon:yes gene_type:complete